MMMHCVSYKHAQRMIDSKAHITMKNILLCTTGASPQVVTETLYALFTQGKAYPDEMYVITTASAKAMLVEGLLTQGHLQALYEEYGMPAVTFDESHIWLIEDEQGQPVFDAKGEEDQAIWPISSLAKWRN